MILRTNSTVKRQPEARSSSTVEKPFGGSSRSSRSEFTSSGNGINLPYMSYVMLGGRMHWRGHVILVRLTTFGGSNTREMVYDVCLCVTPVYPSIHSILNVPYGIHPHRLGIPSICPPRHPQAILIQQRNSTASPTRSSMALSKPYF